MTSLLTGRLQLRPYRATEAALVHALISDLRVFFWRDKPGTLLEAEEILATSMKRHEESSMGIWGVFERDTKTFVGQVILQPLPETREPEIGYHFLVESQGKGYATEAARRLLDHGFTDMALPRIVAVVLPDNTPSQAVMKNLGLPYVKDLMKSDMLHNYFALNRADYTSRP